VFPQVVITLGTFNTTAKIQIALSEDFLDYNDEVIHYYRWSLSDSLEITTNIFKDLAMLCKFTRFYIKLFTFTFP
jgi:hypothetical protein